jgi:hypothetical protein
MALTDQNSADLAFESARLPKHSHDSGYPAQALARLAELRDEAHQALQWSQVLDRSPQASLALMLLGGLILSEASLEGGALLSEAFAWSLWVLTGILAMTVIYIRGFARHPALQPLEMAVGELRKFLLYTGLAWGLGTFLIMPDQPSLGLVLSFGVLPGWAMTVILKNESAAFAFNAPAALLAATACALKPWPHGLLAAAMIVLAWLSAAFMLHCANNQRVPALR